MKKKRLIFILAIVVVIGILLFIKFNDISTTGKSVETQSVEIVPLNVGEQQKVFQTISTSEFFQDVPEKNPIALTFFSFENGQRVWRDGFLMSNGQFLTEGEPTVYLMLHSKYIAELNSGNLCEVIQRANKNGDLAFHSEYSTASLLVKYAGMLKYRNCFGF
jgi:hypothetical protein